MLDVVDALEAAAGRRDDQISSNERRAARSVANVGRAKGTIGRFLENVPDDATAFELREALERVTIATG